MASTIIAILSTIIAIPIGGLITFLVARCYYEKASKDLENAAGELRKYTIMLINLLDDEGVINVERDEYGNPKRVVRVDATASARASASLETKKLPREENEARERSDSQEQPES